MEKQIAILSYSCPPVIGGVEKIMGAHAKLMADNGCKPVLMVGVGKQFDKRIPVEIIPELSPQKNKIKKITQNLGKGKIPSNFEKVKDSLKQVLKKKLQSFDKVFIHNVMSMHFNLPAAVALFEIIRESFTLHRNRVSPRPELGTKAGAGPQKFIVWLHDHTFTRRRYKDFQRKEYPWDVLLKTVPGACYIAQSRFRAKELSKQTGLSLKKIKIVPNGLDIREYLDISPEVYKIYTALKLGIRALILFLPVRVLPRKNIELAIRVTSALKKKKVDIALLLTGAYDPYNLDAKKYYRYLKDLVKKLNLKEEVFFLKEERGGFNITDKMVRDLFQICDILFFPSKEEGFGIPLIEAGVCQRPVIASNIPPFKEIGKGTDVVYFNLNESPQSIAKRIIEIKEKSQTHKLYKRVLKKYSWETIFNKQIKPLL